MQRVGVNRRRIIFETLAIVLLVVLIVIDQLTKLYFSTNLNKYETISVIDGFFYFTYTTNTGGGFSLLANKPWAQTFFKILTSISLVLFVALYVYSSKKGYKWLRFALIFVISGTVGNFIDRLLMNHVIDFISLVFWGYHFPVFNIADCCLVVGVIMVIIHFLFLDNSAIFNFKKKDENEQVSNNND